jgi:hypothetical protein
MLKQMERTHKTSTLKEEREADEARTAAQSRLTELLPPTKPV